MAKKTQEVCARCKSPATHRTRFYGRRGFYIVLYCSKHALPHSQPLVSAASEGEQTGL